MSDSVTKTLKVKLEGSEVDAQYGDFVLKSNTETVTKMITSVAGVVGVENCVKMGTAAAAATAIYFVAKSMLKYWPWMRVSNVKKDNVLEVEIPKEHEDKFDEMVAKGRITQNVNTDLEDIDTNLEGVVGREAYVKYAKEIKRLIKHAKVASVQADQTSGLPKTMTSNKIILGEDTSTSHDEIVLVAGKGEGILAGTYQGENSKVARKEVGARAMIVHGYEGKDLDKVLDAHKELAGNSIKITVEGEHLSNPFEEAFKPTATILHVIRAIRKKEKKDVSIFRDGKELDDDKTIAEVARTGSVLTLKALTVSEMDALNPSMEH